MTQSAPTYRADTIGDANDLTTAHIVASGDSMLLAIIHQRLGAHVVAIDSVTWSHPTPQTFTLAKDVTMAGGNARTSIYYLLDPSSGTYNVTLALTGAPTTFRVGLVSVIGDVHPTKPIYSNEVAGKSGSRANGNLTIRSLKDALIIHACTTEQDPDPETFSHTEVYASFINAGAIQLQYGSIPNLSQQFYEIGLTGTLNIAAVAVAFRPAYNSQAYLLTLGASTH